MATEGHTDSLLSLKGRGNLTGAAGFVTAGLFILPLLLVLFKLSGLPGSETVRNVLSLSGLQGGVAQHIEMVLFVPLAALLIVVFRVTFGIRVLGPFRSILLAVAFQITGITIGLIFLTLVIFVIAAVRPLFKAIRLPYFGRVAATLSIVVIIIVTVLVTGRLANISALTGVAYFPIVVLCLSGEGFAKTLNREGLKSALWRGAMTALAAVIITGLASINVLADIMKRFPELILVQVGMIIIVSEYFGFRLLAPLNPAPRKPRGKKPESRKSAGTHRQPATYSRQDSALALDGGSANDRGEKT